MIDWRESILTVCADRLLPALLVLGLLLAGSVASGCSSSDLRPVEIPPFAPSLNGATVTELTGGVPEAPPAGAVTVPTLRRVFEDAPPRDVLRVQRITIDRTGPGLAGTVLLQYERGSSLVEATFSGPVPGEALDLFPQRTAEQARMSGSPVPDSIDSRIPLLADSLQKARREADSLRAQVRGTPEAREVEARVSQKKPGWWTRQYRKVRDLLAFMGLVGLLVGAVLLWGRVSVRLPFP